MTTFIKHLFGWRIAYDTETGQRVYFNDRTMSRHCYKLADVLAISVMEA